MTEEAPKPADTLSDEGGMTCWWLATAWSKEDIIREYDYDGDMTPEKLTEQWHVCRWTTPEERADEDWCYEQFGDWKESGVSTDVVYYNCKPGTPGAHLYWTTEGPPVSERVADHERTQETRCIHDAMQKHDLAMQPVLDAIDAALRSGQVDTESMMETIGSHVDWWVDKMAGSEGQ